MILTQYSYIQHSEYRGRSIVRNAGTGRWAVRSGARIYFERLALRDVRAALDAVASGQLADPTAGR